MSEYIAYKNYILEQFNFYRIINYKTGYDQRKISTMQYFIKFLKSCVFFFFLEQKTKLNKERNKINLNEEFLGNPEEYFKT